MKFPYPILVAGGGITGITASVELAEAGHEVVLVERQHYLGGNVAGFNNYFPKLCPPVCGLEINYRRIRANPRIRCYTGAVMSEISGTEGDFRVKLSLEAKLINDRCTACGKCAEVCPVDRKEVNGIYGKEKAAYVPDGLSFPMKYTIDARVCEREACGRCLTVCDFDAIHLDARPSEIVLSVHRIILATGWQPYDAGKLDNYSYAEDPDVVTNLEFERLLAACTSGKRPLSRPSDGRLPARIAFVQCAGSRDHNHLPYCSSVCCPATLKHVLTLSELSPDMKPEVFYIDLRVTGRNEKLLEKAERNGRIVFTKGKVGRIHPAGKGSGPVVEAEDIAAARKRREAFDMVVLATGLVPSAVGCGLPVTESGFFIPGKVPGIIPAGAAHRPMEVSASVKDATAASLKALRM